MPAPHRSKGDAPDAQASPSEREVRAQLDRILASPEFDATERSRKFLKYVVVETLAGRGDLIKAYSIATDVFGRGASFDAQYDPVVRIEAGHLRRALNLYHMTVGASDEIVISIPKGSYVPKFEVRQRADPSAAKATPSVSLRGLAFSAVALAALAIASWYGLSATTSDRLAAPAVPRLLVQPFDDLTDNGNSSAIARGLTREVIGQIAKFKDIVTIEGNPNSQPGDPAAKMPRYVLAGDVEMTDDEFRVRARVTNSGDNSVIWANSYNGDLKASKLIAAEAEIARQVATALGQPYGVIFQADASKQPRNAPDDWQAYACTLSYYAYRASLDAKTHPTVRKCLDDAVQRFPNYATAWALLSQTYIDEIRFRYPIDPSSSPASIDRALAAARRAVELDPENIRALQAEMFALFFNGDVAASLKVGELAWSINPNDTELAGEYGYRLALSGNWERGCRMIDETRQRNPGPLAYYESALALCSYFSGNFAEAAMWITKTPAQANPNYHAIAAAIFGETGQADAAKRERDWLYAHAPKLVANLRAEMAIRIARPEDIDRLIASLRKAGVVQTSDGSASVVGAALPPLTAD